MLTVPVAAEAVSSGRNAKPDALSKRRIAITWPSLRKRTHLAKAAAKAGVEQDSRLGPYSRRVIGGDHGIQTQLGDREGGTVCQRQR